MIDIKKAQTELIKHVEELHPNNPRAKIKLEHIMRVAKISKKIAIELKLTKEQIQLAELIGLLHDIGRFEQYKQLKTNQKFNHGEVGVAILKKENYIRKYCTENIYYNIIYKAIYEHNRYQLTEGLTEEEKLFCKIIKDADKIDLLYEAVFIYWQEPERIKEVEQGNLSKKMLEDFHNYKLADVRNKKGETDQILRFASFVFDINFPCSFEILKESDIISKMINKFEYQIPETKKEMKKIEKIANKYIKEKCK